MKNLCKFTAVAGFVTSIAALSSQAGVFTVTNITGTNGNFAAPSGDVIITSDADVVTGGDLLVAVNYGTATTGVTQVNGVDFVNANDGTTLVGVDGVSFTFAGTPQVISDTSAPASPELADFDNLSNDYQALLGEGLNRTTNNSFLNLSGLEEETTYVIQFWVNDSALDPNGVYNAPGNRTFISGNAGANTSIVIADATVGNFQVAVNNGLQTGGVGSFVTGELETGAGETGASIILAGNVSVNAVQVRTIPEPGSMALLGLGSGLLLFRRRSSPASNKG